jgi:hypothetical protein
MSVNGGGGRGGGGANVRGGNVNRSGNNVAVNRGGNTINASRNTNVQVNAGYGGGCCGGGYYGGGYHPVARGMAVGAAAAMTAAAVGSYVSTLPPGCTPYNAYYNCGGTYYQPQYQGSDVTYVVVDNPG